MVVKVRRYCPQKGCKGTMSNRGLRYRKGATYRILQCRLCGYRTYVLATFKGRQD